MENGNKELGEQLNSGLKSIANAITPWSGTIAVTDAAGVTVASLTEALMGVTAGLVSISASISDLAEAVRERNT